MLARGGNAVDAAVAASFCLSVARPYCSGLGGGGFMLIYRRPGRDPVPPPPIALDYRETAPSAVGPDYFEQLADPLASQLGGHAVAVPGAVAGLLHALERYGSLDRETVCAPAIAAAEQGWAADHHYVQSATKLVRWCAEEPARRKQHPFLWQRLLAEGSIGLGTVIRLPEQAAAFRLIVEHGAPAFYRGPIAEAVVAATRAAGGGVTAGDLAGFAPVERSPLAGAFSGRRVLTMPPPSTGGAALLATLGILERYTVRRRIRLDLLGHNQADYVHIVTEALKHACADRAEWFGDPDFAPVPLDRLLTARHLDQLASRIERPRTLEPLAYGLGSRVLPPAGGHGTSHLCVIDALGNAVSLSETLNLPFGSRLAVDRFGFLLNSTMDDFTTRDATANAFELRQSERNRPAPGKRPLSSMAPTIVLGLDGGVEIVSGASGGPRILSAMVQALLNTLVFAMEPEAAVTAPRFHHQWWPNRLELEWSAPQRSQDLPRALVETSMLATSQFAPARGQLMARGHAVVDAEEAGVVQLIARARDETRELTYSAASDPRKGGAAAGPSGPPHIPPGASS